MDLVVVVALAVRAGQDQPVDGRGSSTASGARARTPHTQTPWAAACSARNVRRRAVGRLGDPVGAIENPVENISVSTTRPGAGARPRRRSSARRGEVASRRPPSTMSCWIAGDLHRRQALRAAGAPPRRSPRALAEREAHERRARPPRRRRTRRSGTATTPHRSGSERQNAMPSSSPSGRMSARDEVRALRPEHVEAGLAQPVAQPVPLAPAARARTSAKYSSGRRSPTAIGVLERAAADVGEELLGRAHRGDELGPVRRPSRPSTP